MDDRTTPRLIRNWLSLAGASLAAVSGVVILFFLIVSLLSTRVNPYIGIMVYLILPIFLILGLLLIPIGIFIEWRLRQRTGKITYRRWPRIDLNNPRHRKSTVLFLLSLLLFILASSVGVYQAYHYTESVSFCGTTCHRVMKPEYTAYQDSPHARVLCVECHIGPGAGWYAKSKLTGLYQVYAVLADAYPRPIPTPIKDLRPAQETCETCHWPRAFFGAKQRLFFHYRYDEKNTAWPIDMLVRIGGGSPKTGQSMGIHWHMNIAVRIEYIARDRRRQDIPWIRVTDRTTGRIMLYQDKDKQLTPAEIKAAQPRIMDCMDCHNRPSHNYQSPDYAVDLAILTGRIDPSLPFIKKQAVEALSAKYPSDDAAMTGIANALRAFYRRNYPAVAEQKEREIRQAVIAVQAAYERNIFPDMKTNWSEYPNDIGHFTFRGCMRCHDGRHVNQAGNAIPNGCRTCHSILTQGPGMVREKTMVETGQEFRHPVDIGGAWKDGGCYQCHTGVQP